MRKDLQPQFEGWGIWLETIEITEVMISSKKLFEDLQAEFRTETRLKASKIELEQKEKIEENKQQSNLRMVHLEQNNATKKAETENSEKLKRANLKIEFNLKEKELEMKNLQLETDLEIKRLAAQAKIEE